MSVALDTPAHADEYLLSSLFRDLLPDLSPAAQTCQVPLPNPALFPGPRFFAPCAEATLRLVMKL